MKRIEKLIVVVLVAGLLIACEKQNTNSGKLSVTCSSDMVCRSNDPLKSSDPPPEISCIKFIYKDDSLLTMTHFNAGFNCCPEKFSTVIQLKSDSLIIQEKELKQGCKCNCLFNLEIEIKNLPAGTYHVRFVEPYVKQAMPQLVFDMDLKKDPVGEFCVTRSEGWWR